MTELKIVATIVIKEAHKAELLKAFHAVVDETRKERGNISYTLHQDAKNPLKFVILEVWQSEEAIDFHNASAHFDEFKKSIDGKIDSLSIDIIKEIY